jgi:CDP-glucose 4,6-dehydratase
MERAMKAIVNANFWQGKRVFITGHTGFKGGWLSLWLNSMGATVKGFALEPRSQPSLFQEARINEVVESEIGDIRDYSAIDESIKGFEPDILIHLAAQPLVRLSYSDPIDTYSTNVMGSLNVLEACRRCSRLRVVVSVTTDKCYENREWEWGYREQDPLGGHDPYSSSKACVEIMTNAFRRSYLSSGGGFALATVRAGNVIGGGDWALDRLIPDALKAFEKKQSVMVRNPQAYRPWQHVLEPLSGYLVLAEKMWESRNEYSEAWNFGPRDDDVKPVSWILDRMCEIWGPGAAWAVDETPQLHEAGLLKLDISKAEYRLNWSPTWKLHETLARIVRWHKGRLNSEPTKDMCLREIEEFSADMAQRS